MNQLLKKLKNSQQQITIGGRYAHYKNTAKTYVVINVAILESTEEPYIVYKAEYDDKITFVRPVSEWLEKVDRTTRRFELID